MIAKGLGPLAVDLVQLGVLAEERQHVVLERRRCVLPVRRRRALGLQVPEPRGGRVAEQATAPNHRWARGLLLTVLLHRSAQRLLGLPLQTTGQFVREAVVLRCALAAGEVTDEMQAIAAKLREN